jgi:hypothetical protein
VLVHDPLPADARTPCATEKIRYARGERGENLRIDCECFFSSDSGCMKLKPNPFQTDHGYKFLLVAKQP